MYSLTIRIVQQQDILSISGKVILNDKAKMFLITTLLSSNVSSNHLKKTPQPQNMKAIKNVQWVPIVIPIALIRTSGF